MSGELGENQISALLESVPGIASVLRNPVADALVNMIKAGAKQGPFYAEDAEELIQFAVRRKIIGPKEGEKILGEVTKAAKGKTRPPKVIVRPPPSEKRRAFGSARKVTPAPAPAAKPTVKKTATRAAKKATKVGAKKAATKGGKKAAKKVAKKATKKVSKKASKTAKKVAKRRK